MERVCDWDATISISRGKLLTVMPCFQSGPFDEKRRNRILSRTENTCRFQLHTSRREAFEERATNAVILHVAGEPDATLKLALTRPSTMTISKSLAELAQANEIEFTGPFTSESLLLHRVVTPDLFRTSFRFTDQGRRGQTDLYYVRAIQANGHAAWSSPIWVNG